MTVWHMCQREYPASPFPSTSNLFSNQLRPEIYYDSKNAPREDVMDASIIDRNRFIPYYIPEQVALDLIIMSLSNHSVIELLKAKFNLAIGKKIEYPSPQNDDEYESSLMEIQTHDPVLQTEPITCDQNDDVIEFRRSIIHGKLVVFCIDFRYEWKNSGVLMRRTGSERTSSTYPSVTDFIGTQRNSNYFAVVLDRIRQYCKRNQLKVLDYRGTFSYIIVYL